MRGLPHAQTTHHSQGVLLTDLLTQNPSGMKETSSEDSFTTGLLPWSSHKLVFLIHGADIRYRKQVQQNRLGNVCKVYYS